MLDESGFVIPVGRSAKKSYSPILFFYFYKRRILISESDVICMLIGFSLIEGRSQYILIGLEIRFE